MLSTFRKAAATHGFPASTLTDNGRVFTVRLFGGTPGRNQDLHVTIVHAVTGEILRDLIIDPRKDYQGTGRPPGPPKK